MNNERITDYLPGRAPAERVWDRIEKHLDKKISQSVEIPEWRYALAAFSILLAFSAVVAVFY